MKNFTKNYLKVLSIFNLVFGILYLFAAVLSICSAALINSTLSTIQNSPSLDYLFIIAFVQIILGSVFLCSYSDLKRYSKMERILDLKKHRGSIIGWNIFSMIMYGFNIFIIVSLLLIKDYIDEKDINHIKSSNENDIDNKNTTDSNNLQQTEALIQAQKMKEAGLISEEEYTGVKRKILGL